MSNRFSEKRVEVECRSCGKTITTSDKLLNECRECHLKRDTDLSDEASGYEKQGFKAEMEGWKY